MTEELIYTPDKRVKTSELEVRFCGHRIYAPTARETFQITLNLIAGLVGGYSTLSDYCDDVSLTKESFYLRCPKSYEEHLIKPMGEYYIWVNYSNEHKKQRLDNIIEKFDLQDKFYITVK